jgi:hypothetical protein
MHGFLYSDGTYTTVNYPLGGTGQLKGYPLGTMLTGINNLGVVTGLYADSSGNNHGLVDVAGRFTTVNFPGAGSGDQEGTVLFGLNDLGVIIGGYFDTKGLCHGYIYVAGKFIPVNVPGAVPAPYAFVASGPTDINNAGVIVGGYYNSKKVENGFSLTLSH